ncbi:DUF554 domain-containing protein [Latilactobacillus sakei]|uniref:DUF554 domain-containing protein n=1 Tax=Latilactobacillus sakei TaxID=1599 RepID=UPI00232D2ACC|nr:DUF554 domain-containing protein [Latilactobacillus sakei]MDB1553266.1 DUF554 domain-containing protein [Latilactobacillus sakei]
MPTGVIINSLSVLFGGIIGGLLGDKLSARFKTEITLIFGVCSMGMGINAIVVMRNIPAVILAIVLGTGIGLAVHFGHWIDRGAILMEKPISKLFPVRKTTLTDAEFISALVTVIVLFCAGGTGIYGTLDAGMTGNSTILISKSVLDFFTAAIFACNLGYVVSAIAIPQFIIFYIIFLLAKLIFPLTTPTMIADFKACGGFLMLATGFRMVKIKEFPIADMIPAMILVMPLSWLWTTVIMPLLS